MSVGAIAKLLLGFLPVVLIASSSAEAKPLRCDVTSKQQCTPAGCKEVAGKIWNFTDLERQTFARCDSLGCDTYPANISESDEYLTIEVSGRGLVAKLAKTTGDFLEVATLTNIAYVSFGVCHD